MDSKANVAIVVFLITARQHFFMSNLSNFVINGYDDLVTFEVRVMNRIKKADTSTKRDFNLLFKNIRNQYTEISKLKVRLRQNPRALHFLAKIEKIQADIDLNIQYIKDNLLFVILCI